MTDVVRHAPKQAQDGQEPTPEDVHRLLGRHVLADGFDFVLDLEASRGSWLVDALTGHQYLDLFSFFASLPLGANPPVLTEDPDTMAALRSASINKTANPDTYTAAYARFVTTFARVLGDPALPHLFFIDGGALAVENALKAAFDWKAQRLGTDTANHLSVLHLENAFHGRSGYTLSLTNTDPAKTERFPQFTWPRIPSPAQRFPLDRYTAQNAAADASALAAARTAFEQAGGTIACFVAEPIQGEGGDNHLSARFLQGMQELCHEFDALFVLDEVQTGCGSSGTAWAYQQLGLEPDLVAFGKKTQVCGVMGGRRVDEVPRNVFQVSSRISSTWGGNLTDMVRATALLEAIEREDRFSMVARTGAYLQQQLVALAARHPEVLDNPRGRGLLAAVDLPDQITRDLVLAHLYRIERVIALPCGERSLRMRPALNISTGEVDQAIEALDRSVLAVSAST
ncbi:L-lysine 6-transaminase [Streptomyces decoyicus]